MSLTEGVKTLPYKIDSKFAFNFDELQNIQLANRKSDIGFSEDEKLMVQMRPGTSGVGDIHNGGGGVSNQFFFTDYFRQRRHIKGFDNKIWKLDGATWVDLGLSFIGNNFKFNSIKLPVMTDGTIPTIHTSNLNSSGPEQIKAGSSDNTVDPIGQYLIIVDDPTNNQAYRGCFSSILSFENAEYTLNGAGITSAVLSGAKYQIYDTLGEYLQIINGMQYEKYVFVKENGDFVENLNYTGVATKNLRSVKALNADQFVEKQLSYDSTYWTFNKGTLYYSSGSLNNPFFYLFTTALTIPGNNGGDIQDIFIFKGRLIIGGNNFISYINGFSELIEVESITNSYGIIPNSLTDIGIDAYFLSSNRQIYSLAETITGILHATNIGKIMNNYLKDFLFGVCSGYDGKNLYFYGQKDANTEGKIIVLDIEYKFWSTYTGLRPSSIVLENGTVYLSDNNSSIIRHFSPTQEDMGSKIEQKISIKDITLGDPFSTKTLSDIYLWLDNYDQELYVDTYMSISRGNLKKETKTISTKSVSIIEASAPMGEGVLGEGVLGGVAAEQQATYPFMKHISYSSDKALVWKVVITGKNGSGFFLNQLDIEIGFNDAKAKKYFSPGDTI